LTHKFVERPSIVFISFDKKKHLGLSSNTHLAESSVKDANFSQITGRNEILSSCCAIARSGIVQYLNATTKEQKSSALPKKGPNRSAVAIGILQQQQDKLNELLLCLRNKEEWQRIRSFIGV